VTGDQTVLFAIGGLSLVCLALLVALLVVLLVVLLRLRAGSRRTTADLASLRQRLDELERQRVQTSPAVSVTAPAEFVITDLGHERTSVEPVRLDGPAFADVVLKETVVKAASLAHGVRRGLAPASRNRIRFEMRQEVRRARKQRRADLKAAQRDLHSRQRATLRVDTGEAS
jgi:hypothetical protein